MMSIEPILYRNFERIVFAPEDNVFIVKHRQLLHCDSIISGDHIHHSLLCLQWSL